MCNVFTGNVLFCLRWWLICEQPVTDMNVGGM